jgi:hypothetical protein
VPFSPEVNALEAEVGGDQQIMAGRAAEYGAIVPDAGSEP